MTRQTSQDRMFVIDKPSDQLHSVNLFACRLQLIRDWCMNQKQFVTEIFSLGFFSAAM